MRRESMGIPPTVNAAWPLVATSLPDRNCAKAHGMVSQERRNATCSMLRYGPYSREERRMAQTRTKPTRKGRPRTMPETTRGGASKSAAHPTTPAATMRPQDEAPPARGELADQTPRSKRGARSTGQKLARARHGFDEHPASHPVAGAFGRAGDLAPEEKSLLDSEHDETPDLLG